MGPELCREVLNVLLLQRTPADVWRFYELFRRRVAYPHHSWLPSGHGPHAPLGLMEAISVQVRREPELLSVP